MSESFLSFVSHMLIFLREEITGDIKQKNFLHRYAAIAHYKLVHIHPFADGNGRTSRLLMNMILMQAGYPPVIIHKQHRHKYYEHLQTANAGDVRPFVRFIAECTEQTLDLFLWATSEFSRQVPALSQEILFTEEHNTIVVEDTDGDILEDD